MELLVHTINSVELEADPTWTVGATWKLNGVEKGPLSVTPPTSGVATATLPYIAEEGQVEVNWTITIPSSGTYLRTDYHRVVTPYLTVREVKRIWEAASDQEARDVESAARHIINAHCGQSFGWYYGTKRIRGTGAPYLALTDRLIDVTGVYGYPYGHPVMIAGGGWYLAAAGAGALVPPIRNDIDGLNTSTYMSGSPISAPIRMGGGYAFSNPYYEVTGKWGWQSVPNEVKEATKLLVNDYATGDNVYRDRYLTSMTAADWRIQFHNGAFSKTGNVRADQLLEGFVLQRGWVVI